MKVFSLIFIFLVVPLHAREKSTLHILALVPMVQGNETTLPVENWRRGWEMIPGANLAVDMINNDSTILQDTFLKLIIINSNADDPFSSLVDFLEVSKDGDNTIVATIGMFYYKEIEIISSLAVKSNSLQLSTSMSPKAFDRERFPQQFHMVQSTSVQVKALFSLMEFYNWTGLSVITSGSDPLYLQTAEALYSTSRQYPGITVRSQIHKTTANFNDIAFDRLKSNIIIISMNIQDTVKLICTAHLKNLIGPKYIWIILSHSVDDFKLHATTSCTVDNLSEGILFIQQHLTVRDHNLKLISGLTYNDLSRKLQQTPTVNPYAYVLHDEIWTVALALNESNDTDISVTLNDIDFTGASGPVKFVNNERKGLSVEILQVRDATTTSFGSFINDNLTVANGSILRNFNERKDVRIRILQRTSVVYVAISYSNIIVCTIFTTLVFILYLYFRKKAAIKATCTVVSMMIFLSCYLILFYLSILNIVSIPQYQQVSNNFKEFICTTRQWLNGLAIPTNLILSTMIAKMVRVYRIFKTPLSTRKTKSWKSCQSNSILFLQILLMMIPNLLILILWSAIDAYNIKTTHTRDIESGEIIAVQQCDSHRLLSWLIPLLLYIIVLLVTLVVVAVKTRKIRYKNFKDTKKVNALVFVLILTIVLTLSHWFILRRVAKSDTILQHSMLQIGHTLMIYELMGFLFVPKIYPLIKEKWFIKCCLGHKD